MLWSFDWCFYDFENENVVYCDTDEEVTDEQMKRNFIKIPVAQARMIRHAKGLPMLSPPVEVVYAPGVE